MGGRNLLISFVGYNEDSIEKVSYQSENNQFNLVIQPKEGIPPITSDKIKYSYFGSQVGMVLTVGVNHWASLGELYSRNKESFEENQSLNIDVNPQNQQFAKINFVKSEMSSLSEMVTLLLSSLNLPFDEDIASNLLLGMKKATFNFSLEKAGVSTFEAVALCLRAGGRRPLHEPQPQRRIEPRRQRVGPQPQRRPSPDWYRPKIYKGDTKV
ncbi:hypothetical protein FJZ41_00160 [Candidatus Shapirobacteria bacterium]|nr:hypothetical protein [Candidatus Shapirobacteria bacterium]